MAQRQPPRGLSTYFTHVAYDMDLNVIGERGDRRYLEHRIYQVERWLALLQYRIERVKQRPVLSAEMSSLMMDLTYLLSVRQALMESLRLLPAT